MSALVYVILVFGCFLLVLAAVGCVKFPDTLTRMAAVSKSSTLGSTLFCGAAALHFSQWDLSLILGLSALILFLGIPVSSHLLSRIRVQNLNENPIRTSRNDLE